MSQQRNLRKIYSDSRFRTTDSSSTSNFKIQLQDILHNDENTSYLINEISFPNTFRSVETGINDKLYIKWYFYDTHPKTTAYSVITIPSDNYTGISLGLTLQDLVKLVANAYTIRDDYFNFKCSYTLNINSFNISSTLRVGLDSRNTWQILTDNELRNIDPSIIPGLDKNNLCSFNDNIKIMICFLLFMTVIKQKKDIHVNF